LIVTKDGCEVITRFPAEELLVAGVRYYTASGPLPTTRETQSNLNVQADGHQSESITTSKGRETPLRA
jgi:hypothetical protein